MDAYPEWRLYEQCTRPYFSSKGQQRACTIDEMQGIPPLSEAEVYTLSWTDADRDRVSLLRAMFGYSYLEARQIPRNYADWFIQFRIATMPKPKD